MRRHFLTVSSAFILLTASQCYAQRVVNVGVASTTPGGTTTVSVALLEGTGTDNLSGVQIDLSYDSQNTPITTAPSGGPDCQVNPAIDKNGTSFAFLPNGCSGTTCTQVRAIVLSMGDLSAIAPGSELFTCNITVPSSTPIGNYPVSVSAALGSDSSGNPISVLMSDGFINVANSSGC
jgi:hypothetical protein